MSAADQLPPAFMGRMRQLLGAEADAFFASYADAPRAGLRVNLLKATPDQLRAALPFGLEPVPWCPSGFFVAEGARPGRHPLHAAGLFYLQEPSAMAVAEALDVQPGQRVLDLAAAPGGKSTHIAALLGNQGLLVANEIEASRIKPLGENLERWGARNVVVLNAAPDRLAAQLGPVFDRVLLDAPCSGEGMFRKSPVAQAEWSVEHVHGCAVRQGKILQSAAQLVRPGGRLVYSTCTFAPEEDEAQIALFLQEHPGWELVPLALAPGFAKARPEWAVPPLPELERAVRLWPHRLAGEGHFVAALQRGMDAVAPPATESPRRRDDRARPLPRPAAEPPALAAWRRFAADFLAVALPETQLRAVGEHVYLLPPDLPDLGALRVVRPGLWLGTAKPGRFEPSHALALALSGADARQTVPLGDEDAARWMRGETLPSAGPDGWALMLTYGWPLGWGRRVGGTVKNFYPKGLRRP